MISGLIKYNPDKHLMAKGSGMYFREQEPVIYGCEDYFEPKIVCSYSIESSLMSNYVMIGDFLNELGFRFELKQLARISEFLLANPSVLFDLKNLPKVIPSYFPDPKLSLDLYSDTEEDYCVLYVDILNSLDAKEAFAQEREFFKKYFKSIYKRHKGLFNIREKSLN